MVNTGTSVTKLPPRPEIGKPGCSVSLQSLSGTRCAELHIALGTVNVVPKDMQSGPISLCFGSHSILRVVSSQATPFPLDSLNNNEPCAHRV